LSSLVFAIIGKLSTKFVQTQYYYFSMFQTAILKKKRNLVSTEYSTEGVQSVLPPGVNSSERETVHCHLCVADVRNT